MGAITNVYWAHTHTRTTASSCPGLVHTCQTHATPTLQMPHMLHSQVQGVSVHPTHVSQSCTWNTHLMCMHHCTAHTTYHTSCTVHMKHTLQTSTHHEVLCCTYHIHVLHKATTMPCTKYSTTLTAHLTGTHVHAFVPMHVHICMRSHIHTHRGLRAEVA